MSNVDFKVGDLVQVRFKVDPPVDECSGERMWVKVTCVGIAGKIATGILDNDPVVRTDLKAGEEVGFHFGDVLQVWRDDS